MSRSLFPCEKMLNGVLLDCGADGLLSLWALEGEACPRNAPRISYARQYRLKSKQPLS
jgi:hypothetical protein